MAQHTSRCYSVSHQVLANIIGNVLCSSYDSVTLFICTSHFFMRSTVFYQQQERNIQRSQIWRMSGPGNGCPSSYPTIRPAQQADLQGCLWNTLLPVCSSWIRIRHGSPCCWKTLLSLSYACPNTSQMYKLVVWFGCTWLYLHWAQVYDFSCASNRMHYTLCPPENMSATEVEQGRTQLTLCTHAWNMTLTKHKRLGVLQHWMN